ncbi:MAG: CNNM domain-containing protein [Verrucomicrobiota bacterium]
MVWVLIVILVLISFVFSGVETALLSITRARLRHHAEQGNSAASRLIALLEEPRRILLVTLVINNACNIFAFGLIALSLYHRFGSWGFVMAFLISLPLYILWIELIPKSVFRNYPFGLLSRMVGILEGLDLLFRPIAWLINSLFGRNASSRELAEKKSSLDQSREAFRELTTSIQKEGTLEEDETELIKQVLDFEDISAREVMLPLRKVTAIPLEMPLETVVQLAKDTNFDQFPVMSSSGDLVGLIRVIEILRDDSEQKRVSDFIRRLIRSSPDEKAIRVLERLRRARVEISAVYSPRGRPLGIVSSHDIVQAMMLPDES